MKSALFVAAIAAVSARRLEGVEAAFIPLTDASCNTYPTECTGNTKIDAVLKKANIGCNMGLNKANTKYTWKGFC